MGKLQNSVLLIAAVLSGTACLSAGDVPAAEFSPDANTKMLLHFNEGKGNTSVDSGANKHEAEVNDASWSGGKFDKALSFSKEDKSHVVVPYHPDLSAQGEMTIEAWVKVDEPSKKGECIILHKGKYPNYNYAFRLMNGKMGFRINDAGKDKIIEDKSAVDNEWHHWAGVLKGNQAMLFKDGVLVGKAYHSGEVNTGDEDLWIGCYIGGAFGGYYFTGVLDEIRLSNTARYSK